MKNFVWLGAFALLLTSGAILLGSRASAQQCATCPTQVVAFSPVVINTVPVDDRWYPGKLIGRFGQRLFGRAPEPATSFVVAHPVTFAAPQTFAVPHATSFAPTACMSCGVNPCGCQTCFTQTSFRPVVMQPVVQHATSFAPGCSTCGVATTTVYDAAPAAGCANCTTNNYAEQAIHQAPVASGHSGIAPPPTFREPEPRSEPTPASGTSASEATNNWQPPQLFAPGDKQVKRPSTTVWTAVYEQPAAPRHPAVQAVSTAQAPPAPVKQQPTVTWVAVE